MKDLLQSYKKLNQSFRKDLIYHLGINAGFFAEYTYMVHAILYCLQHKLRFKLYSADANFGYDKGWNDYFEPFCEEVTDSFHHKYNKHSVPSWKRVVAISVKQKNLAFIKWKFKSLYHIVLADILTVKTYGKRVKLNRHVKFIHNQYFYIPKLNIDGDYLHAFVRITEIIWHFNEHVSERSQKIISELQLPSNYLGCQIRGGDKITETELLSFDFYIRFIKTKTTEQNVFVLTDDYRLFQQLQEFCPDICWFTLCTPEEKGYVNNEFAKTNGERKKEQMIRFLISMQVLLDSSCFVGSITTGPSLFILKKHSNAYAIDCDPKDFPVAAIVSIAEKSKMSIKYIASLRQG